MKKVLRRLWSWFVREDIPENEEDIKKRKVPDYKANFTLEESYIDKTGWKYPVSGSIELSGENAIIRYYSKAKLLPLDMIAILFSNIEIVERAKKCHMKAPAFNITVDIAENGYGGTSDVIVHKESKVDKVSTKVVTNKTMKFQTAAVNKAYEGNIVQLYRIYKFICNPIAVVWSDEVTNKDIGESDETIDWITPQ